MTSHFTTLLPCLQLSPAPPWPDPATYEDVDGIPQKLKHANIYETVPYDNSMEKSSKKSEVSCPAVPLIVSLVFCTVYVLGTSPLYVCVYFVLFCICVCHCRYILLVMSWWLYVCLIVSLSFVEKEMVCCRYMAVSHCIVFVYILIHLSIWCFLLLFIHVSFL